MPRKMVYKAESEIGHFTWPGRRVGRGLGKANSYWPNFGGAGIVAELKGLLAAMRREQDVQTPTPNPDYVAGQ